MLKIYICACKDKQYLKEAKICIDSLRKNGQFHGLIYLLTDIPQFLEKLHFDLTNVEVIKVKCGSNKMSAVLRTRLFHYIENYEYRMIFSYILILILLLLNHCLHLILFVIKYKYMDIIVLLKKVIVFQEILPKTHISHQNPVFVPEYCYFVRL